MPRPGAALTRCETCEGTGYVPKAVPCYHAGVCPCSNEEPCGDCNDGVLPCDTCGSRAVAVEAGVFVCARCAPEAMEVAA